MRPTVGEFDVGTDTIRCDQPIISCVAVDLKDARKPLQYPFGMLPATPWSVGKGYAGWSTSAPRSVIAGQRPEVSSFGFAGTGIEDWRTGLVHEQLGGPLQVGDQSVEDRTKFECRSADPVGQRRTVKINALAAHDLGLSVKRQVIGIFGDQHMRDGRLCRQSGLDQSCRRWSLGNAVGASAAGIFGTTRDDDAELRRNDIQPLGYVLADAMQVSAASADQTFRFDDLFDTGKMGGKRATIGGTEFRLRLPRRAIGFIFGMNGGNGRFQVFQRKIELLRIGLLGFAAEGGLLESCDQLLQSLDPFILANFTRLRRDQHGLQRSNVVWKIGGIQHARSLSNPVRLCRNNPLPESSCRIYSMASGGLASTERTRRQSRPANNASNWAWPSVIRPSLMPGQVKVCSSSRL